MFSYLSPKPKLYGSSFLWGTRRSMIRIPLETNFSSHPHSQSLVSITRHSFGEDLVKAFTSDSDSQYSFLIFLGAPSTAIHHPHEVGLDPRHAIIGKPVTSKPAGFNNSAKLETAPILGLVYHKHVTQSIFSLLSRPLQP